MYGLSSEQYGLHGGLCTVRFKLNKFEHVGGGGAGPCTGVHGQTDMTENMTSPTPLGSGEDNKPRPV